MDEIQIAEINSQVRRYLEGTLDEIDVRSLSSGPCPPYPGHPPTYAGLALEPHRMGAVGMEWVVLDPWPWALQPTEASASMFRVTRMGVPLRVASILE